MKNIIKNNLLKITAIALYRVIVGCESDNVVYGGEQALAAFVKDVASLPVGEAGVSSIKIGVEVSTVSTTDRTIVVSVDPKSTILATQYKLDAATLVIPAGSYLGEIVVTGNFDNLVANQTVRLFLNLDSVGDATLEKTSKAFELLVFKTCESKLGGSFSFSTTNITSPDAGGRSVAGPVTGTVTFTATTPGAYTISDGSFGGFRALYFAAYGDTAATGLSLTDICNKIAYSGKDQYGFTYSFTNVVVNGNKLTFNWASGFGEKGLTTLTRTDGTNWPNLKS
jgi:hypothetical protein